MRGLRLSILGAVTLLSVSAWAASSVVIEDWSSQPLGAHGVPAGWEKQQWGTPTYDFTIVESGGRKALRLRSKDDGSTIAKDVKGKVNLKETPILEWTWKVSVLPKGADSRRRETDDQAAQIFVGWERFPKLLRSRIIGYVWDTTQPAGTICKSEKTGTVTYVVVRSGPAELNKWLTEKRNIVEDFKKIYGEAPDDPAVLSLSIDSNDTNSTSEAMVGAIRFKSQ